MPRRPYALGGGAEYAIEPDATAASYFLALPLAVGGSLTLPHFTGCLAPGRPRVRRRPAGGRPDGGIRGGRPDGLLQRRAPDGPRPGFPRLFRHLSDPRRAGPAARGADRHQRHRPHPQAGDRPGGRDGARTPATGPAGRGDQRHPRDPSAPAPGGHDRRNLRRPPLRDELCHPRLPRSGARRAPLADRPRSGLLRQDLPRFLRPCSTPSAKARPRHDGRPRLSSSSPSTGAPPPANRPPPGP